MPSYDTAPQQSYVYGTVMVLFQERKDGAMVMVLTWEMRGQFPPLQQTSCVIFKQAA